MAKGRDLLFETLEQLGIEYIFGNPGTTELPVIDGCTAHPAVKYVTALHEDIAVGMAMGYARITGKVGVANLHVAPGLAHGLGNLYNAYRAGIPLVVTAGQQHTRLKITEPILTGDLVAMAKPFTKWSYEVQNIEEWPVVLQRAFKAAMTPPTGPVFLSLPSDVMLAETADKALPVTRLRAQVHAVEEEVAKAVSILLEAKKPLLVVGDGVGLAGGWQEAAALAERIGAPVYTEALSTLDNFPNQHPLYAGVVPAAPAPMRSLFADADVAILCGFTAQMPVAYFDEAGPIIPPGLKLIFIHENPWEIAKNQSADAALLGDVKRSLAMLDEGLATGAPQRLAERTRMVQEQVAQRRRRLQAQAATEWDQEPISILRLATEVGNLMPADGVLVVEAISNTAPFANLVPSRDPLGWWAGKGGGLGHGAAAALGIKMGAPDRPVINVVGDGTFLYYPQVLWTAVNQHLPVLFVILNNTSYRILKQGLRGMGGPWGPEGSYPPGMDITDPDVDFAGLARSFGMEGERVTDPSALRAALQRGLVANRPFLLDVAIDKRLG